MVLEAVILCLDNSDWCRNGDYHPSRWESQVEAANLISESKCEKNPENGIGVISMAGKRVEVHVTLTNDLAMILNATKNVNLASECDFITALNISTLALKHRANKNQKQRIILFIGSPIKHSVEEMTQIGKKLKKYNIAVDIISFGNVDENRSHIEKFYNSVNNANNSSILEVPVGYYIMDSLFTSPIMNEEMMNVESDMGGVGVSGSVPAQEQPNVNQQGVGMSQFERDMNLALQMSLEEEKKKQTDQTKQTKGEDVDMKPIEEENEEDELEKARLMSLKEHDDMVKKQNEEEEKVKDELLGNEDFINDLLKDIPTDKINEEDVKDMMKKLKEDKDKEGGDKK